MYPKYFNPYDPLARHGSSAVGSLTKHVPIKIIYIINVENTKDSIAHSPTGIFQSREIFAPKPVFPFVPSNLSHNLLKASIGAQPIEIHFLSRCFRDSPYRPYFMYTIQSQRWNKDLTANTMHQGPYFLTYPNTSNFPTRIEYGDRRCCPACQTSKLSVKYLAYQHKIRPHQNYFTLSMWTSTSVTPTTVNPLTPSQPSFPFLSCSFSLRPYNSKRKSP